MISKNSYKDIWYISKYAKPPLFGDPTRQFFFSKYMAKKGRKMLLISSRSSNVTLPPTLNFKNYHAYDCEGVNGILINGPKIKDGFNLKRIYSWILFEVKLLSWSLFKAKKKPDVIIVSSLSILTFLSGILLKRKYGCKLIVEVRDIWPLTVIESKNWNKNNIFLRFLSFIEKKGYKNADAIVGTMPNLKEHVQKITPLYADKVHYVPMGYDPDFLYQSKGEDPHEFFFNQIPKDHFIVGYAGSIGLANCVDQIIEAARLLKNEAIVFAILGSGPLKNQLIYDVNKSNLKNVYFFDKVPKQMVGHFLKHMHLLINPWKGGNSIYNYGVSPNKWIDYMASAKPILVSLDGYPCIINEANCGKFIRADNPELMAEEILKFSKMERTELKKMGENGRTYLIEQLSYANLADKYLEVIDSI